MKVTGEKKMSKHGRTVMVGIKMDAQSRELLNWALVKVAQPGDTVFALHVLPETSPAPSPSFEHGVPASAVSLLDFDCLRTVYGGICELKKIDLHMRISRDSSVRKALVREAKRLSASDVVLGVGKKNHGIRFHSIAKYCAKNLTDDCMVQAVNNGKIYFQKDAIKGNTGNKTSQDSQPTSSNKSVVLDGRSHDKTSESSEQKYRSSSIRSIAYANKKNSMLLEPRDDFLYALPRRKYGTKSSLKNSSASISPVVLNCDPSIASEAAKSSNSTSSVVSNSTTYDKLIERDDFVDMTEVQKPDNSQASVSLSINSLPEEMPGWPLLRRNVVHTKKNSYLKSKLSIVSSIKDIDIVDGWSRDRGNEVLHSSDFSSGEKSSKLPKQLEVLCEKYSSTCRLFTFQELVESTSNFSPDKFIGKGGSSNVYKGVLPNGRQVAVKILKQTECVLEEFCLEVEIITALQHKNIASLSGFCLDCGKLILVYDYMSRGSLEENLHGAKENKNSIGWTERCKIALGLADALNYLHSGGSFEAVIHRDVKSSNILLSDDLEAKLSDFGLATWTSSASSHLTCSDVAGTFGYLAPEYFMFGKVSEKIDVYAFGVVLLELLSGKKPIENEHPKGQESLIMWTKPIIQSRNFTKLLDPSLGSKYDEDQMERMILAASLCLKRTPRLRPTMAMVLNILRGDDVEMINSARLQINASEEMEALEEEETMTCLPTDFQSHLNLALLDVEDDILSVGSVDATDYIMTHSSLEAYLQGRCTRSASFN